ncbi:DUF6643 family protein [Streptomyces sp. MS2.AVA.5]|uniref:DUF6643 family protein n=1 Tax=Streptomyces achmelvichensis TaxID=3134111 RepID=A0ACC6PL63_9ACTN
MDLLRSAYGDSYRSASYPDTPIYNALVAERGNPLMAPIWGYLAYEVGIGQPRALGPITSTRSAVNGGPPSPQQVPARYPSHQAADSLGYSVPQRPYQQRAQGSSAGQRAIAPMPRPRHGFAATAGAPCCPDRHGGTDSDLQRFGIGRALGGQCA